VAAHQHHRILPELPGHVAALLHVDDQEIGRVAEFVGDIPDRNVLPMSLATWATQHIGVLRC
jgi:hypothetical protein